MVGAVGGLLPTRVSPAAGSTRQPQPPRNCHQPRQQISISPFPSSCLSTRCQEHSGNGRNTSLSLGQGLPSGTSQCGYPQTLLTPSSSEIPSRGLEPLGAGPPLTQQDEGDEQHDEHGDTEDERKAPLAHAGSSEHGGSWQQGRGRVRGQLPPWGTQTLLSPSGLWESRATHSPTCPVVTVLSLAPHTPGKHQPMSVTSLPPSIPPHPARDQGHGSPILTCALTG